MHLTYTDTGRLLPAQGLLAGLGALLLTLLVTSVLALPPNYIQRCSAASNRMQTGLPAQDESATELDRFRAYWLWIWAKEARITLSRDEAGEMLRLGSFTPDVR